MLHPTCDGKGTSTVNYPVAYHGRPASLRPAMRSGWWLVWPESDHGARIVRGRAVRSALEGPITSYEATRRYPEHAAAINDRPETTD